VNTVPIAIAIGLTTEQRIWVVWRSEFLPTLTSYLFGALAAAVAIAVMESSGYWLTLLLAALPLYLTWNVYRAGVESEARQGAILEAANDAIISVDQDQRIREFNPAAERMFGWRRLDILGKPVDMLMPLATRKRQLEALLQYQGTGAGPLAAGHQVETVARRAGGGEFRVEMSVARVGEGRASRITGFVRDISERRALEEQLRQSQKLEAIGRLASGVAHDFNNLLMSIVGSADLLLMQLPAGDPLRTEASEIKRSVERGAGLTRQLLAFSRRQATSPKRVALDDVVGGMEVLLRRLIGTEVELEIVRGARPVVVMADPGQIEQVILNLVINARDAMPDGARSARLSVSDTGTGIDTATRARLFEPFFTTKAENKGSGLGLSIVYGIVKQNGGSVEVVSERGKGATFHVYLPLATAGEALAAAPGSAGRSAETV
jgi:two-component system, cell cycle sensor histidine kinase and response regulator CckA